MIKYIKYIRGLKVVHVKQNTMDSKVTDVKLCNEKPCRCKPGCFFNDLFIFCFYKAKHLNGCISLIPSEMLVSDKLLASDLHVSYRTSRKEFIIKVTLKSTTLCTEKVFSPELVVQDLEKCNSFDDVHGQVYEWLHKHYVCQGCGSIGMINDKVINCVRNDKRYCVGCLYHLECNKTEESCPICLEVLKCPYKRPCYTCGKIFHRQCLLKYFQNSLKPCPMCKNNMLPLDSDDEY